MPQPWVKRRQSREHPNLARIKAENSRTFRGCRSRERPCFCLTEVKSRERPYSFRNSCSREHPCRQLGGSDLVPSAPCRAFIYPGPATEWWPCKAAVIGFVARGARRGARTLGAVCARCGRGTLGAVCARCGRGTLGAVCARCGRGPLFTLLYLSLKLKLITNTAQPLFTLCTNGGFCC